MAVIDASAAAGLIVELPWSNEARTAMAAQNERIAPSIFVAELTAATWKNIRADVISIQQGLSAIEAVLSIVELVADSNLVESALQIAVSQRHPVYDCFYLALAMERRQPLLTADMKLAEIARRLNRPVQLLL